MMTNKEFFNKVVNDIENLSNIKLYIAQGNEDILASVDNAINAIRMVFAFKFWNIIAWEFNSKVNPILSIDPSTYMKNRDMYFNVYNHDIFIFRYKIDGCYYYCKGKGRSQNKYRYPEFAMVDYYLTTMNQWNNECISQYDNDGVKKYKNDK